MLSKNIVLYIYNSGIKPLNEIKDNFDLAERTARSLLQDIRATEKEHGFTLKTEYGQGYRIDVFDDALFNRYIKEASENYGGNRHMRVYMMLFYLLQQESYVSIQSVGDYTGVSRNTVLRDFEDLQDILDEHNLKLCSKAHFGVKIEGKEEDIRRAISKFVVNSSSYTKVTQAYFNYVVDIDRNVIEEIIFNALDAEGFSITKMAMDSVIDHIFVLLFRLSQANYIQSMTVVETEIDLDMYYKAASQIIESLKLLYSMDIPNIEIQYLASQIAGKTSVDTIPENLKENLMKRIVDILTIIDNENFTAFSQDHMLMDTLLMHMYPLLTRIAYKIELNNPLIDLVSSRYASVFLVALRFVELWGLDDALDFSNDEVGYLALHFAGHIERTRQETIDKYRRILLISEIGRGNVILLKQKIETSFPKSLVNITEHVYATAINESKADLVLSTIRLEDQTIRAPIYYIKEHIDEHDIQQIKNFMVLRYTTNANQNGLSWIDQLFSEDFFWSTNKEDYLEILENASTYMASVGVAHPSFPKLVIEREQKFSTVYENGIAGPHGMLLNANIQNIAVIIPEKTLRYQNRDIEIIFLINLKKGNLFMYREISRILHTLTLKPTIVRRLKRAADFTEFIETLKLIND